MIGFGVGVAHGTAIIAGAGPVEQAGDESGIAAGGEPRVESECAHTLGDARVDVVISDMAPNMSGMRGVDQPRAMYLVELALEFTARVLKPGGVFVAKVFQGEGSDLLLAAARKQFARVLVRKPDASRQESREVYWVASGHRATTQSE